MGAWGVTARESDTGLDYLAIVEKQHFEKNGYSYFEVKEVMEFLHSFILDGIKRENKGCPDEDMELYIQSAFPYRYGHAVILIAECLADYIDNGVLEVDRYVAGADEPQVMRIANFVYTKDDLRRLLSDLQSILQADHDLYEVWRESNSFDEWQAHMNTLRGKLEQHIEA